jgi:peptidoglycan-associated lipoprotein
MAAGLFQARLKGGVMLNRGVMVTRGSHLIVIALTVSAALAGCAKRPATTQAAAPAPTGVAGATGTVPPLATAPPSTPATAAPQTPPSTARPSPKEFVSIPELKDVYFDFDKYDIRAGDARILDTNAGWLKSNPDQLVLIEGHCDERGTNEYNLALGERRAKATMNYLVSQGVQATRITIISYGEERPVCTEHNEACWSRNRHAHFLVKPR